MRALQSNDSAPNDLLLTLSSPSMQKRKRSSNLEGRGSGDAEYRDEGAGESVGLEPAG
jgi:hypothetical protein